MSMSWFTKNQAVVRSSTLGLLVLAGAVTVDLKAPSPEIVFTHPETVRSTKVSLVSLRASLQDPAAMINSGQAYFDLDDPTN